NWRFEFNNPILAHGVSTPMLVDNLAVNTSRIRLPFKYGRTPLLSLTPPQGPLLIFSGKIFTGHAFYSLDASKRRCLFKKELRNVFNGSDLNK
ncbi:MAG: hypothetical protein VCE91_17810, partial [Nitrospinota bacterium]